MEVCEYSSLWGFRQSDDVVWDDYEEIFQENILNYKIANIKIYFNSRGNEEEADIVGISLTYRNCYTCETKEIEHKGTDNISGMKELKIKNGEYLSKFKIYFKNGQPEFISKMSFITNKGNILTVGSSDGEEIHLTPNEQNIIYMSTFGGLRTKIKSFGCTYVKKEDYFKANLMRFFILKFMIKKNKSFKEEWDKKIKELKMDDQILWRAVNLPDSTFGSIIKFCFI